MWQNKILVVEDDPNIRELIELYLTKHNYQVLLAQDGEQALQLFAQESPELLILDVMLPTIDGLEICKRIRAISYVPILFLSSKSNSEDIVTGLEAGGDTYLAKPFDPSVLVAKVKAHLRRQSYTQQETSLLKFAELEINLESYEVRSNGVLLTLSAKELQLLLLLAQNPNQVFSVEQIYSQVWGPYEYSDTRTVMVHMSHLRKKIEIDPFNPRHIITVRGFGYKFLAN